MAAQKNHGGFKLSHSGELSNNALEELRYLTRYFYILGIDKATNNIAIIYIMHIRGMAFKRLQGKDFELQSKSMAEILCLVTIDMEVLFPEIIFKFLGLPYLFASFKLHKLKYRWITSATKCSFSSLDNMITQSLKLILLELGSLCGDQFVSMFNLHCMNTTFCWMIESLYEFIMNMLAPICIVCTIDITQCYEKIPLSGSNNLHDALDFIIRKGFSQHNSSSRQHSIWVHINTDIGLADHTKWDKKLLGSSYCIEMSSERLMKVQSWLINNCFIRLGDTV